MYRKVENAPREAEDFELPFEGKLSQDNRWVIMASLVPWEEFEVSKNGSGNRGQLIVDASCVPGDISYPNDLGILNQARVKTEKIIDNLYEPLKDKIEKKPKSYRNRARKEYLNVAKKKRQTRKQIRKAIKKQLQYVKRNLGSIDALVKAGSSFEALSHADYKSLLVVSEVYRQQAWMYKNKVHRIDNRIVSLSQPHIRPIVRGKAGVPVEFGAKISASVRDGYVFLDRIS